MISKKWLAVLIIFLFSVAFVVADPPKISLVVKPMGGEAPLTVLATEGSGDTTIISWLYDFGNGDKPTTKPEAEYIYEKPGEYTVSLEVMNEKGEASTDSVVVVVKEPVTITPTPEPTTIPDPLEIPTRIVYQGSTAIRDSLASKSPEVSANVLLSTATSASLKDVAYPYDISTSKNDGTKTIVTTFKVQKYRCDKITEICGYWIEAIRDGKEVQTNSPIWISPPPYQALVSDIYYTALDEKTVTTDMNLAAIEVVTLKEDPKLAVEQILQRYVDMQPLGKATVGTKE